MIDFETKVFTRLYNVVAPKCAEGKFINDTVPDASALPAGIAYEMDNSTVRNRQTSTPVENYARITWTLEFYAGKKATLKKISNAADKAMLEMNFSRMSGSYVPNLDNDKVKRWVGRYEAVVDTEGNLYRI